MICAILVTRLSFLSPTISFDPPPAPTSARSGQWRGTVPLETVSVAATFVGPSTQLAATSRIEQHVARPTGRAVQVGTMAVVMDVGERIDF